MAADALLDQFQLLYPEPNIYRLGQYAPVSIRDQIVRSCYLLDRLWVTGLLAVNTRLLIIGAGAAGVTAAMRAARYGVQQVTIADSSDRVLSLQAGCSSRWIDPAQYDWPARHWSRGEWPIREHKGFSWPTAHFIAAPVPLKAAYADDWSADFDLALQSYLTAGSVVFLPFSKVTGWVSSSGSYLVQITDLSVGAPAPSVPADLIIFAGGLGQEICSVPLLGGAAGQIYPGLPFWSTDAFETADFGLGHAISDGVLVSGAGDGALQDFIRFVTGQKSAREVWRVVEPLLTQALLRQFDALWHWEELTARSETFAPEYRSRCDRLAALHARYGYVVGALVANNKTWSKVAAAIKGLAAGRAMDKVFLALKADHFDGCYPLNRLVALLCVAYLWREHGHNPLLTFCAVRAAKPVLAGGGWGISVEVEFALGTSCATSTIDLKSWKKSGLTTRRFDGVVIRHGIDPSTLSVKSARLRLQHVPAHLP